MSLRMIPPALTCVLTFKVLRVVVVVCGGVRIACPPRLGLPVLSEPAAWVFSRRPRPSWSRIIHPLPGGSGCGLKVGPGGNDPAFTCVLTFKVLRVVVVRGVCVAMLCSFGSVSLYVCEVITVQPAGFLLMNVLRWSPQILTTS